MATLRVAPAAGKDAAGSQHVRAERLISSGRPGRPLRWAAPARPAGSIRPDRSDPEPMPPSHALRPAFNEGIPNRTNAAPVRNSGEENFQLKRADSGPSQSGQLHRIISAKPGKATAAHDSHRSISSSSPTFRPTTIKTSDRQPHTSQITRPAPERSRLHAVPLKTHASTEHQC
jgi:hypothetical protein